MDFQSWLQSEFDRMKSMIKTNAERNKTFSDIRRVSNDIWSSGHIQKSTVGRDKNAARAGHHNGTYAR